jgi:hypothetical protein
VKAPLPWALQTAGIFGTRKPGVNFECGNCGRGVVSAMEPCKHCGVEFEADIAKCSHCNSWIPAEPRPCAKCNVEFVRNVSEWRMRGKDRMILLPRSLSAEELEAKVRAFEAGGQSTDDRR